MDCTRFQELINDFIFDKIDYSDDLKEFLEHAKTCKSCNEELSRYYTIHRGLGDIPAPEGSEEGADTEEELDNIKSFYDEYFQRQKTMKKAGKISIIIFLFMICCTILFVYLNENGYI